MIPQAAARSRQRARPRAGAAGSPGLELPEAGDVLDGVAGLEDDALVGLQVADDPGCVRFGSTFTACNIAACRCPGRGMSMPLSSRVGTAMTREKDCAASIGRAPRRHPLYGRPPLLVDLHQ